MAPSSGLVSSLPANVAMESTRGSMLAAREMMNQYEVEIQKKFAISAACIVFVLLGAPLALRFPRGGVGLVIGVSLVVFAIYYIGLIAGESLANRTFLTPFWAMWAANILFLATGVYLLTRIEVSSSSSRGGDFAELLDAVRYRWNRRRAVVTVASARAAQPAPSAVATSGSEPPPAPAAERPSTTEPMYGATHEPPAPSSTEPVA
jgi:lipopolysaccharide export system permease protein